MPLGPQQWETPELQNDLTRAPGLRRGDRPTPSGHLPACPVDSDADAVHWPLWPPVSVELDGGHAGTPRGCRVFRVRFSQRFAESWRLQWAAGGMLSSKAQDLSRDSGSPSRPPTLRQGLGAVRPDKADSWAPGRGGQFWRRVASRRPPRGRTTGVQGRGPCQGASARWCLPAGLWSWSCSPPVKITGGRGQAQVLVEENPGVRGPAQGRALSWGGQVPPRPGRGVAAPRPLSGLLPR